MMELIHTSAPSTLSGGSGYGVIAQTENFPKMAIRVLINNSGYQFPEQNAERIPTRSSVLFAHWTLPSELGGHHILSRITPCGFDQSGRPNRIAHHLLMEQQDLTHTGPASVANNFSWVSDWSGPPKILQTKGLIRETNQDSISDSNLSSEVIHTSTLAAVGREQGVILHLEKGQDPLHILLEIESSTDPTSRWAMKWAINTARPFSGQRGNLILSVPGNSSEQELSQHNLNHIHLDKSKTTNGESPAPSYHLPETGGAKPPVEIVGKKYIPPSETKDRPTITEKVEETTLKTVQTEQTSTVISHTGHAHPKNVVVTEQFEVQMIKSTSSKTMPVVAILITAISLSLIGMIIFFSMTNATINQDEPETLLKESNP